MACVRRSFAGLAVGSGSSRNYITIANASRIACRTTSSSRQLGFVAGSQIRQFQSSRHYREAVEANVGKKRAAAPVVKKPRPESKLYKNADDAVADLESGSMVMSAGFGLCGTAGTSFHP
jgi:hypothetical protein